MSSNASFHATIQFALLGLAGLVAANLVGTFQGSQACAAGVFVALLAVGSAYLSQMLTTWELAVREGAPSIPTEIELQVAREQAGRLNQWAVGAQYASCVCAVLSGVLFLAGILP